MPSDWRRFTGPEVSVPYSTYVVGANKTPEELRASLLPTHLEGKRADGRALSQPRALSVVRTGIVSQAKGSAYIEFHETKVICSVFAPREIPNKNEFSGLGQLYCEVKLAMFSCARRRSYAPEADERELSAALRRALEPAVIRHMFPNYQVDVMVHILQNDGGCLAAAVTAAGVALVDAAVPMYDIICATSLAVLDDNIFMDPTEAEENACLSSVDGATTGNHGVVTIAVMPEHDQICDLTLIGSMDADCVSKCLELLHKECLDKLVPEVEQVLLTSVQKAIQQRNQEIELNKDKEEYMKKTIREFREKLNPS